MKKVLVLTIIMALFLGAAVGCSDKTSGPSPVVLADQLLSAEEASEILGLEVTITEGTLNIDEETGLSDTEYVYNYNESTTLRAYLMIKQNGAIPKAAIEAGHTAEAEYEFYLNICQGDAEELDLGDKAFMQKSTGQIFILDGDYFMWLAFGISGDTDETKSINLAIAEKILDNLNN